MIDMKQLAYSEIDSSTYPTQIYFIYDVSSEKIRELVNDIDCCDNDVPDGFNVNNNLSAEIVLTIFSKGDFKLECFVSDENGAQGWYTLDYQMLNAADYLELIPNDIEVSFINGNID
ncbi:hypothetical protein LJB89_03670 [Tyzzerella sp. OttesenSCG-928-J15]|nr:hypothetical protein [Tyzzerella sp. OttesenSCG-928-J15]